MSALNTTVAHDPEALTSIEMTTACDLDTQQKRDDRHLIYFEEPYDIEK